jgi:hypothetical protein
VVALALAAGLWVIRARMHQSGPGRGHHVGES